VSVLWDRKPILYCFVAKVIGEGEVAKTPLRVSLDTAYEYYLKQGKGWAVVGPDPHDEDELADWYKRNPYVEDDGA